MNNIYHYLKSDSRNRKHLKYFNQYYYGLESLKDLKNNNIVDFYLYSCLLDKAYEYNPMFAKRYLDSLLSVSPLSPSNLLFFNEIKSHIYRDEPKSKFEIKHKIKDIFNDHWDNYVDYFSNRMTIPDYVFDNVERMRNCRTAALGYTLFECNECNIIKLNSIHVRADFVLLVVLNTQRNVLMKLLRKLLKLNIDM